MSVHTVSCRIWDQAIPLHWIEIEIGSDTEHPIDVRFWTLTRKSLVSFPNFPDKVDKTEGLWYWSGIKPNDIYDIGIGIRHGPILFDLRDVVENFWMLNCGQGLKGWGEYLPTKTKVDYQMSFMCV
jgi:hypothetical protein